VAEEFALAGQVSGGAASQWSAEQCADLAIETLREAAAAGCQLPDLRSRSAFAALKARPGFAQLVNQ
jgi:hypothetical protein